MSVCVSNNFFLHRPIDLQEGSAQAPLFHAAGRFLSENDADFCGRKILDEIF